jgi:hypothetical protein
MHDDIQKILTDLPALQQIANRPLAEQPLLAVVLAQAKALAELSTWARSAAQLAASVPAEAVPTAAEALGIPDEAVEVVPTGTERFTPEQVSRVLKRPPIEATPAPNGRAKHG